MDLHLHNQVALVTGGSRGLGRAIALGLAQEGVRVAVNYSRSRQRADELVNRIRTEHAVDAIAVQGSVADSADVARIFDQCQSQLGPLDVLVNNAGTWPTAYVKDMTDQQWDETLAVNLRGPFLASREAVRRWLAAGRTGRIVNISSQAAFMGSTTGHAHYASAKAGLVTFTVSLAREVAPHGIYVNAVAPGFMHTDMIQEALSRGEDQLVKRIPLGRIGDPAEIANLVVFLASDRASYTTGATFDASGGMLMR